MIVSLVMFTVIDLGTKELALDHLSTVTPAELRPPVCAPDRHGRTGYQRQPTAAVPLVAGVLNLQYAENCGAAFSMLGTAPGWLRMGIFGTSSVVAVIALITMFVRGVGGRWFAAAVPLIVSGALGNNLFDRPRHGFVVDFLQVDPNLFRYPIFNVADIWIAIGVGLMLIDSARSPRQLAEAPLAPATLSADARDPQS